MLKDRLFIISLVFSLALHTAFLLALPSLNLAPDKNTFQKIEVAYQKIIPIKKDEVKVNESRLIEPLKRIEQLNIAKNPPPNFNDYFLKSKLETEPMNKPVVYYDDKSIAVRPKKVALLEESVSGQGTLPKNPIYLKYYQAIREKIRHYAYYNYNRAYSGEIYLSFTVISDGNLKELRIIEEKSAQNNYLKEIAIKSIKDASRFPAIPQELDYPELSFNVIIAFELD